METVKTIETKKLQILQQLIVTQDEELLNKVQEIIETAAVAGFNSENPAVSQKELLERIDASEAAFDRGEYRSLEELKKETSNW